MLPRCVPLKGEQDEERDRNDQRDLRDLRERVGVFDDQRNRVDPDVYDIQDGLRDRRDLRDLRDRGNQERLVQDEEDPDPNYKSLR